LYVDDMAKACVFVMELTKKQYDQVTTPMQSYLNVGYGSDVTIKELAYIVAKATGYKGKIEFDPSKPDGTLRKLISSERLNQLGWKPECDLEKGIAKTYLDFKNGYE
jgi:GDP-L-fucose synthase